ncbi:hypothetical protein Tco_0118007 [Tanacetum coccineum]
MKAYPKHIDWGKVIATNEIIDGYVMPKYGNKSLFEDDSWIDIIMDDVYHTFYRDEEEEAKVAKVEKFLAMVEFEKARVKDYTKLVVTDGMVDYVLKKYGNKWKSEDEIAYVILEDLWLKYGKDDKGKGNLVEDNEKGKEAEHHHLKVNKDDKGKGKLVEDNGKGKMHDIQNRVGYVEVDSAKAIKAKQVDDHDDDALDTLDLENRIKKLEEDFGRQEKARETELAKQEKKTKEDELKAKEVKKANEGKKAKEAELKAKEAKKSKEVELKAKEAMLAELKAKKAKKAKNSKEEMLAEVVQISSDEDPTAPTSTRSKSPTASTSTKSRAPIVSTYNAQAASTAPRGCVIALFAPNSPNAPPPSATRKRKPT